MKPAHLSSPVRPLGQAPGSRDVPEPFTAFDQHLFAEGTHAALHDKLGCQLRPDGSAHFAVWAPNASAVSVIGDWNLWSAHASPLSRDPSCPGLWQGDAAGVGVGDAYKFRVTGPDGRYTADKADPFARHAELPPATASRTWRSSHRWGDADWMASRAARHARAAPLSIYEVHLGSWRRADEQPLGYRELAPLLADHVIELGFTHVEVLPLTEHPFYGSWGYQTTGYFAPTARHGSPDDFKFFVDHLHQRGIGVLLDWVPSHFPTDEHGLQYFDGTHLYEHADPRQGFHPEWNSSIFNYGRGEVRSFLVSSALYWIETFHLDGLRVDAVASMLYLDYARAPGEWVPNVHGGKENLQAVHFLRTLNAAIHRAHPDVLCIAEESTAWPGVSRPAEEGGLGFALKWNMGWMHDTLSFLHEDPVHRRYHLGRLTFSMVYAFDEQFVLPLSHDEVVHGKGALIDRMPGDAWQRFANLRLLYGLMWAHPGKKLLFMGGEFAQLREWNHDRSLDWPLLEQAPHRGVQSLVARLNALHRSEPALHTQDGVRDGFEWIESNDEAQSVIAFVRLAPGRAHPVLAVFNLTPVPRTDYRLGVPEAGLWEEVLNTDAAEYGGSGWGNFGSARTEPVASHGRPQSLRLTLPPLSATWFAHRPPAAVNPA